MKPPELTRVQNLCRPFKNFVDCEGPLHILENKHVNNTTL